MKKQIIPLLLVCALIFTVPAQALAMYEYSNPGDTNHFVYYKGNYDPVAYPQKSLNSVFTKDYISVDGVMDAAYEVSPSSNIGNVKELSQSEYAVNPDSKAPTGILRSVWDGPVLYLFVEVTDETPIFSETAPSNGGAMTSKPAVPSDRDSVVFGFDFWNDKVVYETDTTAVFTIDSSGNLTYYSSGIPSLGSVHADPKHPEYTNRIKSYAATPTATGYNIELALQIEGTELNNGNTFGVDVQICNVESLKARTIMEKNPWYPWFGSEYDEKVYPEGPGRTSNIFWSHNQDNLYAEYDHERPNATDWGNVTLTGWNGEDDFAPSVWRLTNNLQYLNSIRFPKGVWTSETQADMDLAVDRAEAYLEEIKTVSQAVYETVYANELELAIRNLRWADTTYPDPMELPDQYTLPNPYKFFGSDGKSTRMVTNNADWEERREEILELAQFYEYGNKPGAPDSIIINGVEYGMSGGNWWEPSYPCYQITTSITYGAVTKSLTFDLFMPSDEQLEASGHGNNVPVVLSFDGYNQTYLDSGFAVLSVPAVTGGDTRTNEYAWGARTGIFYEFFPYSRNGAGALNEVSSEMAAAWGASRAIDALELMLDYTGTANDRDVKTLVDPSKLAVTGFSINGKYAFVSAVFDERIDVCIPGAAGATGPSPWRYVYAGQEYDFSDTVWAPDGAAQLIAFGTEFMANSVRHNRVRETETFRRFLTPGNFYKKLDGAYGYGTRLPFDQNDLVATLAPRAIIVENTVNDYNDGSVTDSLSLDLVKSIYSNLGYNVDDLLKYNYRTIQPSGDPHGNDTAQRLRSAEYLDYYFYGNAMSPETSNWLSENPYSLNVSNNKTQSPYDYYYGGYNTITGGTGGISGNNGWYYYSFSDIAPVLEALSAIERGTYHIPFAYQADQATKTKWLQTLVDALIPGGNGSTAKVTYNNGYQVSVTKGAVIQSTRLAVTEEQYDDNSEDGSSTPVVTPTPTPTATPVPTFVASIIGTGTKETTVPMTIDTQRGSAKVDLGTEAKNIFKNEPTAISMPQLSGVTEYTLGVPASLLSGSDEGRLTFATGVGDITIPGNMLSVINEAGKKEAEITIAQGDKSNLPADVQDALGDRPLLQLTLKLGGEQIEWNNPEAPVSVTLPYTPTATELADPEHIVVWYIDGNGKVISVPSGRYDPASGTVTFSTTHFSQYAVAYVHKSFSDLDRVEWARKSIEVMASKGIINGTGENTYSPTINISRADYLVLLVKTLGLTANVDTNFDDVESGAYYYEAIGIAKKLGITTGVGGNLFSPKENISRQDMMVLTARALEKYKVLDHNGDLTVLEKFNDKNKIADYATKWMAILVQDDLIQGSGNTINPGAQTTRAEAAVFLYRIYNKY